MAWVLALGLSAGYLINKNMAMASRLQQSINAYNAEAADDDPKLASSEIRKVQATVPAADRFEAMNIQDLQDADVRTINSARESAKQAVADYEAGQGPIRGIYLTFDNHGV